MSQGYQPSLRAHRPDMVVCRGCEHFGTAPHTQGVHRPRWIFAGRPPSDWDKTCRWLHTQAGRTASFARRLTVMQAGANGGRDCPVGDPTGRLTP